jgi:DNA-binding NtrC family response regulator
MPELRERKEDMPLLVRYFVQKLSRQMKKQIETILTETMNALVGWTWPGNVRELENFIERSVILSRGPILNVPLGELSGARKTRTSMAHWKACAARLLFVCCVKPAECWAGRTHRRRDRV